MFFENPIYGEITTDFRLVVIHGKPKVQRWVMQYRGPLRQAGYCR